MSEYAKVGVVVITTQYGRSKLLATVLPQVVNSILPPSEEPTQVMNVRVFTFRPNTDPNVVTGLVKWDGMNFADRYVVDVTENGQQLSNVSLSSWGD